MFIIFELKLCEGIECHFTVDLWWTGVSENVADTGRYRQHIPSGGYRGEMFVSDLNCTVCILCSAFGGLPGISIVVSHTFPPTRHLKSVKVPSYAHTRSNTKQSPNHPNFHTLQLRLRIRTGVPP